MRTAIYRVVGKEGGEIQVLVLYGPETPPIDDLARLLQREKGEELDVVEVLLYPGIEQQQFVITHESWVSR